MLILWLGTVEQRILILLFIERLMRGRDMGLMMELAV